MLYYTSTTLLQWLRRKLGHFFIFIEQIEKSIIKFMPIH